MRVDFDGLVTKRGQKHACSSSRFSLHRISHHRVQDWTVKVLRDMGMLRTNFWPTAGTEHPISQIAILEKQVVMWIEDDDGGRKSLCSRSGQ